MGSVDFPTDFPYIVTHKRVDNIKNHPSFIYAKNGDLDHAYTLVKDLINKEKIEQFKKYSDSIIVPVHLKENDQVNKIPIVYAKVIGKLADLEVDTNIYQSNKIGRTNMTALERLLTRATFEGEVKKGRNYIIVDDVSTQGGTLSELRSYIEKNGGHVVLASTLGYTQFSTILAIRPNNIEEIERRFGRYETEDFLKKYGIADRIEQLTNSEARHILSYKSLDRIREKADEIRNREYSQGIGQNDDERPILREVSNLYGVRNMLQKEIDKERFAEIFSKIFFVNKHRVLDYLSKDENGVKNIFHHPASFDNNYDFVKRVEEFKELSSIIKNVDLDYQISSSTQARNYMRNLLEDYRDRERFTCVFLSAQNNVISHKMFEGTVDEAPLYTREIIKLALNYDAKSLLIGHNHPGGSPTPSQADIYSTSQLINALKTVGVNLLDHIIVAGNREYSFAENSMLREASLRETSFREDTTKYKFQGEHYDMDDIKKMYKEYGKKLEINYNEDDLKKFNELKHIVESDKRQSIESLKKDIEKTKVMGLDKEL